jgi:hypothetical protein
VQAHTHTVQPAHLAIGSVFNEIFFFFMLCFYDSYSCCACAGGESKMEKDKCETQNKGAH